MIENKYIKELEYWAKRYKAEGNTFENKWYKDLYLNITGVAEDIYKGKVIADFGCGPRGSLQWADTAALRIGIDVLVKEYMDNFGETMLKHNMVYINSTERFIPIPNNTVDIISTINSMDHCKDFPRMMDEVFRVLKPGGLFIGSFNLNEPANACEPQTLTKGMIDAVADLYLGKILSYKIGYKCSQGTYNNLMNKNFVEHPDDDKAAILWIYGEKKA